MAGAVVEERQLRGSAGLGSTCRKDSQMAVNVWKKAARAQRRASTRKSRSSVWFQLNVYFQATKKKMSTPSAEEFC